MPASAEQLWASLLKQLSSTGQPARSGQGSSSSAGSNGILSTLEEIRRLTYRSSDWPKLIKHNKVPQKLATIACNAVQRYEVQASSLACSAISSFLDAAAASRELTKGSGFTGSSNAGGTSITVVPSPRSITPLGALVAKQLSMLVQGLPAALDRAAQDVRNLSAAVRTSAQGAAALSSEFEQAACASSSSSLAGDPVSAVLGSAQVLHAVQLLDVLHSFQRRFPDGTFAGLPATILPAGQLAVAVLQCLSTAYQHMPDGAELVGTNSSDRLESTLRVCLGRVLTLAGAADKLLLRNLPELFQQTFAQKNEAQGLLVRVDSSIAQQVVLDPCFLQCLGLLLACSAYACIIQHKPILGAGSSSASKSKSSGAGFNKNSNSSRSSSAKQAAGSGRPSSSRQQGSRGQWEKDINATTRQNQARRLLRMVAEAAGHTTAAAAAAAAAESQEGSAVLFQEMNSQAAKNLQQQLQELHERFLQLLGFNSKVVALAAAADLGLDSFEMSFSTMRYQQYLLEVQLHHFSCKNGHPPLGPAARLPKPQAQQLLAAALQHADFHLFAPSILLLAAANMPVGDEFASLSSSAANTSALALQLWQQLAGVRPDAADSISAAELSAAVARETLPMLLFVLPQLLKKLHEQEAQLKSAADIGSASTSNSRAAAAHDALQTAMRHALQGGASGSSSSGGSSGSPKLTKDLVLQAIGKDNRSLPKHAASAMIATLQFIETLSTFDSQICVTEYLKPTDATQQQQQQQVRSHPSYKAWDQYAAQVCVLLESCVRLSARCPVLTTCAGYPRLIDAVTEVAAFRSSDKPSWLQHAALAAQPGSPVQRKYCSLLLSLIKHSKAAAAPGAAVSVTDAECIAQVLTAAAPFLLMESPKVTGAPPQQPAGSSGGSGGSSSSSSGVGDGSSSSTGGVQTAPHDELGNTVSSSSRQVPSVSSKPAWAPSWLASSVLGRGYMHFAVHLQAAQHSLQNAQGAALLLQQGRDCMRLAAGGVGMTLLACDCMLPTGDDASFDAATSARLSAVGCDVQQLVHGRRAVGDALTEAMTCTLTASAAALGQKLGVLAKQLVAFGEALSTVPCTRACNNPYCSSLEGGSEVEAVSGSSTQCSGCRTARYCSKQCQKQHWKLHKPVCQALGAMRAPDTK